jgi:hypothetical protein
MHFSPTFWSAFKVGLAAPAWLFAPPGRYDTPGLPLSVAESFAAVGNTLRNATDAVRDDTRRADGTSR